MAVISDQGQLLKKLGIDSYEDLESSRRAQKRFIKLWRNKKMTPELISHLQRNNPIVSKLTVEVDAKYFMAPEKIMSLCELYKSDLRSVSGVYGWYFRKIPPHIPTKECEYTRRWGRKWILLYIGRASTNLRGRIIDEHFEGGLVRGSAQSSLRQSLGCLLCRKLRIYLWKYPDFPKREYTFGYEGEQKLSRWMADYARVAWRESPNCVELEEQAIDEYTLPLNTEGNKRPFDPLKILKKSLRQIAPVVGYKEPRKAARKAYKDFKKNCKLLFSCWADSPVQVKYSGPLRPEQLRKETNNGQY